MVNKNPWVEYVRQYALKNNISYGCAISEASKSYKKLKKPDVKKPIKKTIKKPDVKKPDVKKPDVKKPDVKKPIDKKEVKKEEKKPVKKSDLTGFKYFTLDKWDNIFVLKDYVLFQMMLNELAVMVKKNITNELKYYIKWMDELCNKNYKNYGNCIIIADELSPLVYKSYVLKYYQKLDTIDRYFIMLLATNYILVELNKKYNYKPFTSIYMSDGRRVNSMKKNEILSMEHFFRIHNLEKLNLTDSISNEIKNKYQAEPKLVILNKDEYKPNKNSNYKGILSSVDIEQKNALINALEKMKKTQGQKFPDWAQNQLDDLKKQKTIPQYIKKEEPEPIKERKLKKGQLEEFMKLGEKYNKMSENEKKTYDKKQADIERKLSKKKPIVKKPDDSKCFQLLEDTMKLIYSNRMGTKDFQKLQEKYKKQQEFFNIISSSDFYPTPSEYSKIIYDDVQPDKNTYVIDIGAGLGSLSYQFLKNIDKINFLTMIEMQKPFTDILDCFKNIYPNKIDVINNNIFDIDYKLLKPKTMNQHIIYLCNPPFRPVINNKLEAMGWLFWMFYINSFIVNYNSQQLYMIVPKSNTIFDLKEPKYSNDPGLREGTQIFMNDIPKDTGTRILKLLNQHDKKNKYTEDELRIDYITYIQDVDGFKGINKRGKTVNLGIKTMLIKIGI